MRAMKDSGIPWLGQIPEHWQAMRNKDIFQESKEVVGEEASSYTLLSLTKQGVIVRDLTGSKGKFPKEFDTYKKVTPNDMVFCLFDMDETPRTVGLSNHFGMITGAYDIFKVKRAFPRYVLYYFLSVDDQKAFRPLYKGLRKVVQMPTFLAARVPFPPLLEQERIAEYLDRKCEEIDELIGVEEQMIEELQAYKQSVITETVTKGLNPDNDVPQEWPSTTISKLCYTINGLWTGEKGTLLNVGVIRNANFTKDFKLDYSKIEYIDVEEDSFKKRSLLYGDLIVEKSGGSDKTPVGRTVIYEGVDGQYSFSNFTMVLRIKDKNLIRSKYLYYYLLMLYIQGYMNLVQVHTTGLHNLIIGKFLSIVVPLPPLPEQNAIAEYLDKKCAEIDALVEVKQRKIAELKEYKKSVIYEYVTGKREIV